MGGKERFPAGTGVAGSAPGADGNDSGTLEFSRGAESGYALDWLALDKTPFVFLGDRLGVLWSNAAASAELEKRRDVEVRGGALAMTDRGRQAQLEQFLASANGSGVRTWSVARADGDGHLLFRAQRLGESPWRVGLAFYGSGAEFRADYADLGPIFGLTPAETKVLIGLLDGLDAHRIAERDDVSIETTRSHIRAIYLKLDVNSREGLFHRVRPYRL
jgi:DNA-binding CsgD family transcriptional regulator